MIDLDYCAACGGRLELVDGTDPEIAADTGRWTESYRCTVCQGTGTYEVDRTGPQLHERGTGVVA